MGDISKGFAFSGNSPNNVATASNLNNLVDLATIQATLITGKPEVMTPDNGDYLLLYDASAASFARVSIQNLIPQRAQKSGFSQLSMVNSSGTPNSQITISASEIVMLNASGVPRRVTAFSATLDVSLYSLGPVLNGRDFSNLVADKWGYIWAISNGTTDGTLYSTNFTAPTLPAGYTYMAILGAARIDLAGNLVKFFTNNMDTEIFFGNIGSFAHTGNDDYLPMMAGAHQGFSMQKLGSTPGNFIQIDLSRCIPPIATRVRGVIGAADSGGSAYSYGISPTNPTNGFVGSPPVMQNTNVGVVPINTTGRASITTHAAWGFSNVASFDVGLSPAASSSQVWVACDDATNTVHGMRVSGYRLSL